MVKRMANAMFEDPESIGPLKRWVREYEGIFRESLRSVKYIVYKYPFQSVTVLLGIVFFYLFQMGQGSFENFGELVWYTGRYFVGVGISFFLFLFSLSYLRYGYLLLRFNKVFYDKKLVLEAWSENPDFDKKMPDIDWKKNKVPFQYAIDLSMVGLVKEMYQRHKIVSLFLYIATLSLGIICNPFFALLYLASTLFGIVILIFEKKELNRKILQLITDVSFAMYRWHRHYPNKCKSYIFSGDSEYMKEVRWMYKCVIDESAGGPSIGKIISNELKKRRVERKRI